jgi:hypothetical protein
VSEEDIVQESEVGGNLVHRRIVQFTPQVGEAAKGIQLYILRLECFRLYCTSIETQIQVEAHPGSCNVFMQICDQCDGGDFAQYFSPILVSPQG